MTFQGSIPAVVTPFSSGSIDIPAFRRLVERLLDEGASALVVCGTTGECPTLTSEEQATLIREAVRTTKGRVPIIAGAGSNSTQAALQLSYEAKNAGADALLHVTGYYNHPSEAQVIDHFRTLDNHAYLPMLVYNIPSRTGQDLSVDTIVALSELEYLVGVKDATGNVARVTQERLRVTKPFSFLSGEDATSLGYLAHGGQGCISVTANVAPALCAEMIRLALAGDFPGARAINDRLMPLHKALFLEPSPGGAKYALSRLGLCKDELRQPLTPVTPVARAAIDAALVTAGLVSA